MRKYVLANIKIPVLIDENGSFDMLNEYARTEITLLNKLPEIELDDNLYKRIIEFLQTNDLDEQAEDPNESKEKVDEKVEEKVEKKVPLQVESTGLLNVPLTIGSAGPLTIESAGLLKVPLQVESAGLLKVPLQVESAGLLKVPLQVESAGLLEQKLMICKNNIKMRKHADIMTFKNLTKGAKSYTRKMYL